jgi:predicted ester cyclase
MHMSRENVALARRWFEEVWNQRRDGVIDELMTPHSVCYADDGPMTGPAEFKARQYVPFLAAFPDLQVQVEDAIGEGDQVVVRWTAVGTHSGNGLGCAATHRPVLFRGMSWVRVREGKLQEGWQVSNIPEQVRSLMLPGE